MTRLAGEALALQRALPVRNRVSNLDNLAGFCDTSGMKTKIPSVPIILTFAFFSLLPIARAVVPPPDGGYPGFNTAEGTNALLSLTPGSANTAVGWFSLFTNSTASFNTALGAGTLLFNNSDSNTAIGTATLLFNTEGFSNTAVGVSALQSNTTGTQNTALGALSGSNLITGTGNVCIGAGVGGVAEESNHTRIRNIGITALPPGINVVMQDIGGPYGDGILGFASSSRRYKEDIKAMDKASETLFALKPVTFRAKGNMDSGNVKYYGLIAEDVAEVNCDLVVYNPDGKPETLRFDSINAMLLNEFLKAHHKIQEQDANIQRVSDQIEVNTPATQVVVNNE